MKKYDVIIIGAGPAGIYTSIILKKGTPMQVPTENLSVAVVEATKIGGLTQYAFIQITKKWAFSGRALIRSLYEEAVGANVEFFQNYCVTGIKRLSNGSFLIDNGNEILSCKYLVIATGIMTFPNILDDPHKAIIGLHTPKEMVREIELNDKWKNILIVGNELKSISKLAKDISKISNFKKVDYYLATKNTTIKDANYGVKSNLQSKYDGLLFDYNSYKLNNGTTTFLKKFNILQKNNYVITNSFGETKISGLFAVGSVTMPISGVPEAIYSAQITGLYIGHLLEKTTVADPSGRFPFFPREIDWNDSYQHNIEQKMKE